ncbi:hypothetical protein [Mycobacterium sp. E796]|uniref:hypothetical protein n=1 Tax=Mycobacterium sp. E796 TaxID=1834151 RepID=UPI0018D2ED38|nr:hypothetical protein [Mycobacterium sp. E796]
MTTYDIAISFHARRKRVSQLKGAAAEADSPIRRSRPARMIRVELISGGDAKKLIPHLSHQLVVERRAVQADP